MHDLAPELLALSYLRLIRNGPEARAVSVDQESEAGKRGQSCKEHAQATKKVCGGFENNGKTIAETEISQCPDQAAHDSERQKNAKPLSACTGH